MDTLLNEASQLHQLVATQYEGNVQTAMAEANEAFQHFGLAVEHAAEHMPMKKLHRLQLQVMIEKIKEEYDGDGFDYGYLGQDALLYFQREWVLPFPEQKSDSESGESLEASPLEASGD